MSSYTALLPEGFGPVDLDEVIDGIVAALHPVDTESDTQGLVLKFSLANGGEVKVAITERHLLQWLAERAVLALPVVGER